MWEEKATRDAFGEVLLEIGEKDKKLIVFSGDLEDSTRAFHFRDRYPERFYNLGIAEQDLIATATGFALEGFTAVVTSFAVFLTARPYDMIRILGAYNNVNIKIVATHAGLTVGEDGATAQSLEDIAVMRVLPNFTVISPVDAIETKKALREAIKTDGPFYIRLSRAKTAVITSEETEFVIGKAVQMKKGKDISIFATGIMVSKALKAAEELEKEGILVSVTNIHTIKPLDNNFIINEAKKTEAVLTVEEHQKAGGLGSAIAELLVENYPVPMEILAVNDRFGQSGKASELLEEYSLEIEDIVLGAKKLLLRK